jgi:hypothetical protein
VHRRTTEPPCVTRRLAEWLGVIDPVSDSLTQTHWGRETNQSAAPYGMTMQRIMHHTTVHFIDNRKLFVRRLTDKRARTYVPIAPEYAMVVSDKNKYIRDKPIAIGASILDLSKVTMYNFWYRCLKPTFGINVKLLQTDTDSLMIGITSKSMADYESKILGIRDTWLDMSKYPEDHPFHSLKNRKSPGFFKDECGASTIMEVAGVRPKCYSIQNKDPKEDVRRSKGAPKRVVQNSITHEDYVSCIRDKKQTHSQYHDLQFKKHHIILKRSYKKVLDWVDDKSFHHSPTQSLAIGHYLNTFQNTFAALKLINVAEGRAARARTRYGRMIVKRDDPEMADALDILDAQI